MGASSHVAQSPKDGEMPGKQDALSAEDGAKDEEAGGGNEGGAASVDDREDSVGAEEHRENTVVVNKF